MISRKRKRVWTCLCMNVFLILTLTGCWDSNDAERMVYVQGLGVDYKNGKYILYVQLNNLSLLAKTQSQGGGEKPVNSEIGQASGNSVEDALFNIFKTSQRKINWGHLIYIIFTNNALNHNGLQGITDMFDRFYQSHYHIWFYSTKKPLPNVMNIVPPINMSAYLSRLSDPDAAFRQNSFIQSWDMREVIIDNYEPPNEIIIPLVSNNKNDWKGDGKPQNIAEIIGISIIRNDTFKGTITSNDVNGYRWIQKKFKRTGLSLQTKDANTGVVIGKRKVKIKPIIKNSNVQFDIQLKMKGVINKLEKNIPTSQISLEAEKVIKKEVLDTYRKGLELNVDVYRFSNILYKKNFSVWKKIQKGGKIPLTEASIRNIDVNVMIVDGEKQRKIPTFK